jgi:hypothetical protein
VLPIDPNAHKWGDWVVTTPATCTDPGAETRICEHNAAHTETRALPINPPAHQWGAWVVTTDATCSSTGIETRTCEHNAAHTETRVLAIDPDNHTGTTHDVTVAATCIATGLKTTYCDGCNAVLKTEVLAIDPDNHVGNTHKILTVSPTCQYEGSYSIICEACGHSVEDGKIDKVDHFYDTYNIVERNGKQGYICIWCGDFIELEDILTVDGIKVIRDPAYGTGLHGNLIVILPNGTEIKIPQSDLRNSLGGPVSNNYNGPATAIFAYECYLYVITLTFEGSGNGGSNPWRVTHAALRVIGFV